MSYAINAGYYVYGRTPYASLAAKPDELLGYFSDSNYQVLDEPYPQGVFRIAVKPLTAEQQAPQTGRDFAVVNVIIDFTKI